MTLLRVIFLFSMLSVCTHSFPRITSDFESTSLSTSDRLQVQNENSTAQNPKEIVEFVYDNQGNAEKGTNRDKYFTDFGRIISDGQENQTPKPENNNSSNLAQTQDYPIVYNKFLTSGRNLFLPKESSTITFPKYFYESFNPISPFPELDRPYVREAAVHSPFAGPILNPEEPKQPPHVAGPVLSPLGMLREFDLPFYN